MRIDGRREFRASRESVYEALTDPQLVAGSIPALETVQVTDRDHWTASVKVSIAPRLKVAFEVSDQRPPEHARLRARGKNLGGAASIDTSFDLAQSHGRTTMSYEVQVGLSGLLGRIGEPAFRPIAERQMEKLLKAVAERVEGG